MSLSTWKKEFYRIPANKTSVKNAVLHSIKKWTGLLPKNLSKHSVYLNDSNQISDDKNTLDIDSSTCALCYHYEFKDEHKLCKDCCLCKVRNDIRCDSVCSADNDMSPYGQFTSKNNPSYMLMWLKFAQEWEKLNDKNNHKC